MKDNHNFLLQTIAMATPVGACTSIPILMSNLFDPFGFAAAEIALLGLKLLLAGVVGAIAIGILVDKTRKYKLIMQLILVVSATVITICIVFLKFDSENKTMFTTMMILFGFVFIGYFPLGLSFGAELTFPLQPALVNGTQILFGASSAVFFSSLGAYLTRERQEDELLGADELLQERRFRTIVVVFLVAIACSIAFLLSFFIEEDLKRVKYGDQNNDQQENNNEENE